jgi:hypothetical protein
MYNNTKDACGTPCELGNPSGQKNSHACASACSATKGCTGFVYTSNPTDGANCYLKKLPGVVDMAPAPGYVLGVRGH